MSQQRWAVVENERGEVHVVPWLVQPAGGQVAAGHLPEQACPSCLPIRLLGGSGGPLDEPTFSHLQPGWPGEVVRRPPA